VSHSLDSHSSLTFPTTTRYMEFRYAMVKNSPSSLTSDTAKAWVIRYPLGDVVTTDYYDDVSTLPQTTLRRPATIAAFSSSSDALNDVWELVR
jgi:hypothetical protein